MLMSDSASRGNTCTTTRTTCTLQWDTDARPSLLLSIRIRAGGPRAAPPPSIRQPTDWLAHTHHPLLLSGRQRASASPHASGESPHDRQLVLESPPLTSFQPKLLWNWKTKMFHRVISLSFSQSRFQISRKTSSFFVNIKCEIKIASSQAEWGNLLE
jgi:hypothetical protein